MLGISCHNVQIRLYRGRQRFSSFGGQDMRDDDPSLDIAGLRAWWRKQGLPPVDPSAAFDHVRWRQDTANRLLSPKPRAWPWRGATAAALILMLVGSAVWRQSQLGPSSADAVESLYQDHLPAHPLKFNLVVTNHLLHQLDAMTIEDPTAVTGTLSPVVTGALWSSFTGLSTPSRASPGSAWDVLGLPLLITAQSAHAATASLVIRNGSYHITVRNLATGTIVRPWGRVSGAEAWPIPMGGELRITGTSAHKTLTLNLKVSWVLPPPRSPNPEVVGRLPAYSQPVGSPPNPTLIRVPKGATLWGVVPQGVLLQGSHGLGFQSWTGAVVPLVSEPGNRLAQWTPTEVDYPWALLWSTRALWWNLTTGTLSKAPMPIGNPAGFGGETIGWGGSASGIYVNGHKTEELPTALQVLVGSGPTVVGILNGQLGSYDARTQQFTPSGITEVDGHGVADLNLTAVWFPVWGPTLVVSSGEHKPWPNLHAYLVPLDERFPIVRVSPGTNGGPGVAFQWGTGFLVRTTGSQVQAGWPDAGGRWAWHVIGRLTVATQGAPVLPGVVGNAVWWPTGNARYEIWRWPG